METYHSSADQRKIKELSQLAPARTLLALALDWSMIVGAILVSRYYQNPVVYIFTVLIIGGRMHALGVLMHEFAHFRFSTNKTASDWFANVFIAWPIGTTVNSYRLNHLAHHKYTNTMDDPDWVAKLDVMKFTFPQPVRKLLAIAAGYFVAIESIIDLKSILVRVNKSDADTKVSKIARLAFYAAAATILTWTGAWTGFLLYWLVPFLTAFMFFLYVRSVAEHFGSMNYEVELDSTRTVRPHFWERLFFCPHNINYHLEHHLYPGVPFYNLPALQKLLLTDPGYKSKAHFTRGYVTGLVRECSQ